MDLCGQSNVSFLICCLCWSWLFFKKQMSFNFMAVVTICSDFGAQGKKVCHCFHCFPICLEVMGPDAMIFVFWMLSFKPTFSLTSFTFIKRLCSSSSLSAIRGVSSAYLNSQLIRKDPDAEKYWRREKKGTTEDKMVGWHHSMDMSLSKLGEMVKDRDGRNTSWNQDCQEKYQ